MRPRDYLDAFIEQNLLDFESAPGDIRLGFNAAVSMSHFADHYFNFNARHDPKSIAAFRTLGDFVEHLSSITEGAFRDVRSVANAYKHLYTDSDPRHAVHATTSSAGVIETVCFEGLQIWRTWMRSTSYRAKPIWVR